MPMSAAVPDSNTCFWSCRNHGCNQLQCVLCKHNPNKRCTGNFAHKYWVGDKLLAKCEGEIQVEIVDGLTGERVTDDLTNMRLEVGLRLAGSCLFVYPSVCASVCLSCERPHRGAGD